MQATARLCSRRLFSLRLFARGLSTSSPPPPSSTLHHGGDATLSPVKDVLRSLYLSGRGKARAGQPRVVAAVTGGGGHIFADFLREPGASSTLLEGLIPYDKESCLSFLGRHARRNRALGEEVGFCSAEMAQLLAEAARDRALELTPRLVQWPHCVGVGSTATIVSHYTRRGGYRVHAGGCDSSGDAVTFSHEMMKGVRDRAGEDTACALLATRALADAAGLADAAAALSAYGIRREAARDAEGEPTNAVGEQAEGGRVEEVPPRVLRTQVGGNDQPMRPHAYYAGLPKTLVPAAREVHSTVVVHVPRQDGDLSELMEVAAPTGPLPRDAIIVLANTDLAHGDAIAAASDCLKALGRMGDGKTGAWSEPSAPVFFVEPQSLDVWDAIETNCEPDSVDDETDGGGPEGDMAHVFLEAAQKHKDTAGLAGGLPGVDNWGVLSLSHSLCIPNSELYHVPKSIPHSDTNSDTNMCVNSAHVANSDIDSALLAQEATMQYLFSKFSGATFLVTPRQVKSDVLVRPPRGRDEYGEPPMALGQAVARWGGAVVVTAPTETDLYDTKRDSYDEIRFMPGTEGFIWL